jgi:hypothetical protein
VIVIDSLSHEWEGEGGLQDMQAANLDAAVERARGSQYFDETKVRERSNVGAWKEPKMRHKRFVSRLLQCRAHLVICLRAEEKLRMEKVKDDRGRERTVIVQAKDLPPVERWSPICEKRFMYEMTASFVLTPDHPGIPIPIKLQAQHHHAAPAGKHLSEETGLAFSEWSRGGHAPKADDPFDAARAAAEQGVMAFREHWNRLDRAGREPLRARLKELQGIAEKADAADDPFASSPADKPTDPGDDFPGDRPLAAAE